MNTQEIVSKLWNLCNVLRDDGITYQDYVTELTYILFLKMLQETDREKVIAQGVKLAEGDNLTPEQENANKEKQVILDYSWNTLAHKDGLDLFNYYKTLLRVFGDYCTGRVREIYSGASTNIDEPANLKKIITSIDGLDWYWVGGDGVMRSGWVELGGERFYLSERRGSGTFGHMTTGSQFDGAAWYYLNDGVTKSVPAGAVVRGQMVPGGAVDALGRWVG